MVDYALKRLPTDPDAIAPDGFEVRILLGLAGGGMAHFELGPGRVDKAVTHRTVEEIWDVVSGRGEMWRKLGDRESTDAVYPGIALTLPLGVHFQFRSFGDEPLAAIAITMPPWPGEGEAIVVEGPWAPTVSARP